MLTILKNWLNSTVKYLLYKKTKKRNISKFNGVVVRVQYYKRNDEKKIIFNNALDFLVSNQIVWR